MNVIYSFKEYITIYPCGIVQFVFSVESMVIDFEDMSRVMKPVLCLSVLTYYKAKDKHVVRTNTSSSYIGFRGGRNCHNDVAHSDVRRVTTEVSFLWNSLTFLRKEVSNAYLPAKH